MIEAVCIGAEPRSRALEGSASFWFGAIAADENDIVKSREVIVFSSKKT
jgi:hypothetical protein